MRFNSITVKDKTGNDISYNYRVEETAGTLEIVAGVDIGIIINGYFIC